jgi:hypothetical protein
MSDTERNLRSRLFSGETGQSAPDALISALDARFNENERALHQLPGSADLEHEQDGDHRTIPAATTDGVLAVVTDQRLFFGIQAPDSEEIIGIPHTDIRKVDVDEGLLRSTLSVRVWGEGRYELEVSESEQLQAAVSTLTQASTVWQFVVSALQDACEETGTLETHLEAGRPGKAHEAREKANRKLDRASSKIENSDVESPALDERLQSTREELHRAEIRARIARAKTLMTEAGHQTESAAYAGAYRSYWRARDHLENALMIAIENDIQEPALIQSELKTVENRLDHLEVRPIALAKQASERASGTDNLADEVAAWQASFEHYRDALTAGWGTGLDFVGDETELRLRIETVVGNLIAARREYARELEVKGKDHETVESYEQATHQYQMAREELTSAEQLAREFRAGDPDSIRDQRERIESKLDAATWSLTAA